MDNTDNKLSEADSLLEHNQFAQARDAYRSILISGCASRKAIANLGVADNEERLAFWRSVLERFPQDAEYRMGYANELMLSGHLSQAMQACTEMLENSTEMREQLLIRLLRLRAAARSAMLDYFVEDFVRYGTQGERCMALTGFVALFWSLWPGAYIPKRYRASKLLPMRRLVPDILGAS